MHEAVDVFAPGLFDSASTKAVGALDGSGRSMTRIRAAGERP